MNNFVENTNHCDKFSASVIFFHLLFFFAEGKKVKYVDGLTLTRSDFGMGWVGR